MRNHHCLRQINVCGFHLLLSLVHEHELTSSETNARVIIGMCYESKVIETKLCPFEQLKFDSQ